VSHICMYLLIEAVVLALCAAGRHLMIRSAVSARHKRYIALLWSGAMVSVTGLVLAGSITNWGIHYPATSPQHMSMGLNRVLSSTSVLVVVFGAVMSWIFIRRAHRALADVTHARDQARKRQEAAMKLPPVPEEEEPFEWRDDWDRRPLPA
jgi:ATP/ADP translocase